MAYIGVKPTIGNFQICDAISVVNGQAAYTMQVGSVNVSPQSANHMIVSLNGYDNTNLQLNNSSGDLNNMDGVVEYIFSDMVSGSMKKMVFASNKWMVKLASMTRGSDTGFYDTGEKTKSGLRVRSYMGPVGELEFVPHPFLKGAYEDYAIAVDPANFSIR